MFHINADIMAICLDFFFFFQAEDGIRDHCVTGVQTCALPIWRAIGGDFLDAVRYLESEGWTDGLPVIPPTEPLVGETLRSEERRVGKECSFRWLADQLKKN